MTHMADRRPGTVYNFLVVLSSKLTQYDERESKKPRYNPYSLGHYMAAAQKVEADVKGLEDRSDEEALLKLVTALYTYFHDNFPPVKAVVKQIKQWLETGKSPSLVRR